MNKFSTTTIALAAAALFASQAMAADLFGASVAPKRAVQASAGEIATRIAAPDLTVLPGLAKKATDTTGMPTFTLDLFDDVKLAAEVVRTETTAGGGLAIIARLPEKQYGHAVLVQNGNVVTGSVTFPGGAYAILPGDPGMVKIAKIDPSQLPPEAEPVKVNGVAPMMQDLVEADPPADSGKLIDVIVFWTPAARTAAGGVGDANIKTNIDLAITLTNNAYRNSGIAQRVRLVNKQEANYVENTSGGGSAPAFSNALQAITAGGVPTINASTVAAQRDAFGADEVVMVINNGAACGIAWLPSSISSGNANLGFAVVGGDTCLTTNFSFGHELGHNMGAHHDPFVNPEPGAFAYSHGYSKIGASAGVSWRTIMAYNNQCQSAFGSGGCSRLQYFSNPMVTYTDGFVMGDGPARNNALTLNKSANAVSNYRATVVPISASFADMPMGDPQFGYVEFMYQAGITNGCLTGPLRYCPNNPVTRGEMAAFLERSKRGADFSKAATGTVFSDVPAAAPFAGVIEQLFADGVTNGCAGGSPPAFCPNASVNRQEMAKFLLKTRCGAAYTPNTPASSPFPDVAMDNPFLPWIKKLYDLGITNGCSSSPLAYCPFDPVTRGTMAIFIYRTFPHVTPSEVCAP